MAQIIQPYDLSISSVDTSPQEVLLDLFYSLDRLSGTVDDIFGKIEKRVSDERDRISQINTRVDACKRVVDSIRGKQTATTIFSTAKFPAPNKLPAYPTLLSQVTESPPPHRDVEDGVVYYPPSAKQSVVGNADATEESLLLLSRLNAHGSDLERVEFTMEDEGLGPFPAQIEYVGNMLLFNTRLNPYSKYQALDNFMSTGKQKDDEVAAERGLAAAPTSILSGDALPDIEGLDLNFKPQMGTMSSLALPDNLPLDFVATNLNYQGAELPSIAPSAANKPNYDLPQITNGYDVGPTAKEVYVPDVPDVPVPAAPSAPAATAPPPPPPPPMNAGIGGAPPPPPPPSAAAEAAPAIKMPPSVAAPEVAAGGETEEVGEATSPAPAAAASASAGGFVNPLDAIKGMSVSNLRKVAESDLQDIKRERKAEEAAKPKSMMDEMKARMMRRNSAISGKDQKAASRKESLVIQQAQNAAASAPASAPAGVASLSPAAKMPPPPPAGRGGAGAVDVRPKSSSLLKMGFNSVGDLAEKDDEDDSSDDSEPPMVSRAQVFDDSDFSSDDSSISDVSDVAFAAPPVPKMPVAAPAPAPTAAAAAAAPASSISTPAATAESGPGRRGSLLDGQSAHMDSMLSASKVKATIDEEDSDDDWD